MRQVHIRCCDCRATITVSGNHENLIKPLNWFLLNLSHKMDCYSNVLDLEVSDDATKVLP